ncbi:MAG TPA: ABC transporter permease [Bacillota bacterium]|nr:ABC transporter permease [Bacillota bacterium]
MMAKSRKELSEGTLNIISSIISILGGLLIGFLILILLEITKSESTISTPFTVMRNFLTYPLQDSGKFIKVFYNAAPLILCGLAVGFAFKAGLFNIGATGQYTLGAFFALVAAILWQFPWWAAMLVGMVVGAFWGFIPGFFKAVFNINEVITTIMLNWAALNLANLLLYNMPKLRIIPPYNRVDKLIARNPSALLPDLGLKELLGTDFFNIGIIIAIVLAVVMFIVLNKTTFGYEVKACGFNKNASTYAGIKAKRTIIMTMVISGALAGIAGGVSFLAGTIQFNIESNLLAMGFNGIPVALLANSHPLGIIASGLFIGYMQVGGQAFEGVYSSEMTNVILSVIIYFSAFALIVSQVIKNIQKKNRLKRGESDEDGSESVSVPETDDSESEDSPEGANAKTMEVSK